MAVEVKGLKELADALRALPADLASTRGGPLRAALFQGAKLMRDDAKRRVPVDPASSSHVRDHIVLKRSRDPKGEFGATEAYLVTVKFRDKKYKNNAKNRRKGRIGQKWQDFGDFFYWRFLEFGTRKMQAANGGRGFLRPAFEAEKNAALACFQETLAKAIEKANRKVAG